jgi:hypothetical protein
MVCVQATFRILKIATNGSRLGEGRDYGSANVSTKCVRPRHFSQTAGACWRFSLCVGPRSLTVKAILENMKLKICPQENRKKCCEPKFLKNYSFSKVLMHNAKN